MRRAAVAFACAAVFAFAGCGGSDERPAVGTGRGTHASSAAYQKIVDSFRHENELPGVAAAVILPGNDLWVGTSGLADQSAGVPMDEETLVPIGDISKNLTAALVVSLAEERALSLDDSVAKYVTGIPNGERITLRQLLGLTSGLGPVRSSFWRDQIREPGRSWKPKQTLSYMKPPYAAPGEGFRYWDINFNEGFRHGDVNYVLLGLVIEKATGSTVAAELERMLEPLGLADDILLQGEGCIEGEIAHGYQDLGSTPDVFSGDGDVDDTLGLATGWTPDTSSSCGPSLPTPAFAGATFTDGAFIATAGGLARWANALFSGEVVGRESLEQMTTFHSISFTRGGHRNYGLGVVEFPMLGGVWEHEGAYPGYSTYVGYLPDKRVTVVALVNTLFSPRPLADELFVAATRGS